MCYKKTEEREKKDRIPQKVELEVLMLAYEEFKPIIMKKELKKKCFLGKKTSMFEFNFFLLINRMN